MIEPVLTAAIPQLPSGDLQMTADFFVDTLGFEVGWLVPEFKFLSVKRQSVEIHFWLTETPEEAKKLGSASSCYVRVKGIELLFDELKARGAKFRYELVRQPWGMFEMQIDDPFGNAIKFGDPAKEAD